jgi:hypothetical protein
MEEMICAYKIVVEKSEVKRPPRRPRLTRDDNIKMDLKYFGKVVNSINQDMDSWWGCFKFRKETFGFHKSQQTS